MNIHHIIVHEIAKEYNSLTTEIRLSEATLPKDDLATELIKELDALFSGERANYGHGVFKGDDITAPVPAIYEKYIDSRTETEFIRFTQDATRHLDTELKRQNFAKGGYILFVEYEKTTPRKNYMGIFLVRNSKSFKFSTDGSRFELTRQEQLDIRELAMACQVDITKYLNRLVEEGTYLRFTKNSKLSDVSEYFIKWLGVGHYYSDREYTQTFVELIRQIPPPLKETGEEYKNQDEFAADIQRAAQELSRNGVLNLLELGRRFYPENERMFIEFADSNDMAIDVEFKVNSSVIKTLYYYRIKAEGIELQFNRSDFGSKITLDNEEHPSQVIIHSPTLAREILTERLEICQS